MPRDPERKIGERIESLKVMLLTGTPAQQSLARRLLKELSKTARNQKDVTAALAALSTETPKPEVVPEHPKFIISPEGFSPAAIVERRLAGLEVKRGDTLLERAENGDPAAILELRDLYFFADPRYVQQAEEFNTDLWSELKSTLHHPAERPARTCIFSDEELKRAAAALGENTRRCRPMLRRTVEHVWSLIDINRPFYHEILRLTGRVGELPIEKLRAAEKRILAAQNDLDLRVALYESLGETVPVFYPPTYTEASYRPSSPEAGRRFL